MADLTFTQKNAYQLLADKFAEYGLSDPSFIEALKKSILDNTDANGNVASATATAQLRETDVYKARFAGNELRKAKIKEDMANGKLPAMSELSEASYIAMENSYRDIIKNAKLPAQFQGTQFLAKMIGSDLNVSEVTARVSLAQQAAQQANPEIKQKLQQFYGVNENQITSFFLDPEMGKQAIDSVAAGNAAILAASAERSGLSLGQSQAEALAQQIAPEAAQTLTAQKVFAETSKTARLAETSVTGETAGVTASDVILASTGNAEAQAKLEKERQKRQADYQSASGMATTQKGVVGLQRANL